MEKNGGIFPLAACGFYFADTEVLVRVFKRTRGNKRL